MGSPRGIPHLVLGLLFGVLFVPGREPSHPCRASAFHVLQQGYQPIQGICLSMLFLLCLTAGYQIVFQSSLLCPLCFKIFYLPGVVAHTFKPRHPTTTTHTHTALAQPAQGWFHTQHTWSDQKKSQSEDTQGKETMINSISGHVFSVAGCRHL